MVLRLMKNTRCKLMEPTKRGVELAFEQDEDAAMRFIEEAQRASMLITTGETCGHGRNPWYSCPNATPTPNGVE